MGKFVFDGHVVEVFDDMIERSVPLYSEVLKMCAGLIKKIKPQDAVIYDIGCSTCNLFAFLLRVFDGEPFRYVGVDNSLEMLSEAGRRYQSRKNFSLKESSLQEVTFSNADVIVMNYTLQFIPARERSRLLKKLFDALLPGGILIVSEKVLSENDCFEGLHLNYKREKGYSEMEVAQKREALEQVLTPIPLEDNIKNLNTAGFAKTELFFRWFNFVSILAEK